VRGVIALATSTTDRIALTMPDLEISVSDPNA
jgi:hypothetical protein